MTPSLTFRLSSGAAAILLAGAVLVPIASHAQIVVGNSVFPQAGDTLHYALDTSPTGPASQPTPPGFGQLWDFSNLKASTTWTETLRPAATGAGAQYFTSSVDRVVSPAATLVYTQTGPASVNFPLIPGSNGTEAYLQVTDNAVNLLGFYGGNDALHTGVGAFVDGSQTNCVGCDPSSREFLTRYTRTSFPNLPEAGSTRVGGGLPIQLRSAPTSIFDVRQVSVSAMEHYPGFAIPAGVLPFNADEFRHRASIDIVTVWDGSGTLLLPGGSSFEVLREKIMTSVELRVDAYIPPLGWLDMTDVVLQYGALPDVNLRLFRQTTYRYFDADSKESLATVYMTMFDPSQEDPATFTERVEQVQFKNLAAVPEPQTAVLFLAGLAPLWGWARKTRTRA